MGFDTLSGTFAAIPTDWLILGAFAVFAAFDCLRSGARRIATLALAFPAAALIFNGIASTPVLGDITRQFATPILQAILFLVIVLIMYILVARIGLAWGDESGQTIQAALAGVAGTVIVTVFWLQIPALDSLWHFGADIQHIFGAGYGALWLVAAYAALAFVRD